MSQGLSTPYKTPPVKRSSTLKIASNTRNLDPTSESLMPSQNLTRCAPYVVRLPLTSLKQHHTHTILAVPYLYQSKAIQSQIYVLPFTIMTLYHPSSVVASQSLHALRLTNILPIPPSEQKFSKKNPAFQWYTGTR